MKENIQNLNLSDFFFLLQKQYEAKLTFFGGFLKSNKNFKEYLMGNVLVTQPPLKLFKYAHVRNNNTLLMHHLWGRIFSG